MRKQLNFTSLQAKWKTPRKQQAGHDEDETDTPPTANPPNTGRQRHPPNSAAVIAQSRGHFKLPGAGKGDVPLYNAFSSSFSPDRATGSRCAGEEELEVEMDGDECYEMRGEEDMSDDLDSILSSTIAPSTTITSSAAVDMEKRLAELENKLAAMLAAAAAGGQSTATKTEPVSNQITPPTHKPAATANAPPAPPPPPAGLLKSMAKREPLPSKAPLEKILPADAANTSDSSSNKKSSPMDMKDVLRDLGSAMNRLRKVERWVCNYLNPKGPLNKSPQIPGPPAAPP